MILFNCKIAAQKYVFFDYQQTLSPVFDQNTKDLFEKSAFQPHHAPVLSKNSYFCTQTKYGFLPPNTGERNLYHYI